jgi:methionyl-tRNA formyltransferase
LQPPKVGEGAFLEHLSELEPWVAVVVAFGQIFPAKLLALPERGCVNLHASLLPRHRGAAPIQAAIAAGDGISGVSTMVMEEGLDSGPVLMQESVEIGERETGGELAARLSRLGACLMIETLSALERGETRAREQEHDEATYAPRLVKADGRLDWRLKARDLERRVRAFDPWPGTFTMLGSERVKILETEVLAAEGSGEPPVGTILGLRSGLLAVAAGGATVLGVRKLQRSGRQPVCAEDFVRGMRSSAGQSFE